MLPVFVFAVLDVRSDDRLGGIRKHFGACEIIDPNFESTGLSVKHRGGGGIRTLHC